MPADKPLGDPLDLLQQQVENLTQEYAALSAAYARARRVRQLIFLVTLLFIAVICIAFYRRGSRLMDEAYAQQLTNAAQTRLEKNQDQYLRQVELVVKRTSPALSDAFTQQANKDLPVFFKLFERERDAAAKELEEKLAVRLQERYRAQLDRLDAVLAEELPQTKDKVLHDRLTWNLKIVLDRMMKKHYVSLIESEVDELYATWDRFPAAETPRKGDPSIEEQFMAELQHMLIIKLGSTEPVARR